MKVSNKILDKLMAMMIIIFLMMCFIPIINSIFMNYYEYESNQKNVANEKNIQNLYTNKYNEKNKIFYYCGIFLDSNADGDISYEEFKTVYQNYHLSCAQNSLTYYKTFIWVGVGYLIFFIIILICFLRYLKKIDRIIQPIKRYSNYMIATNSYKIEDIAKEFNEDPKLVETNIQKAINQHILKNVYLSKQTKEILLVNKTASNKFTKNNQQNVNVENNVIINNNTTK